MLITGLQNVFQTHGENQHNVIVNQPIVNALTLAAIAHHALFLEETELMAGSGLADANRFRNVPHALFPVQKTVQQLDAGGVSKHRIKIRQFLHFPIGGNFMKAVMSHGYTTFPNTMWAASIYRN
jgi:hypothetical protein